MSLSHLYILPCSSKLVEGESVNLSAVLVSSLLVSVVVAVVAVSIRSVFGRSLGVLLVEETGC